MNHLDEEGYDEVDERLIFDSQQPSDTPAVQAAYPLDVEQTAASIAFPTIASDGVKS